MADHTDKSLDATLPPTIPPTSAHGTIDRDDDVVAATLPPTIAPVATPPASAKAVPLATEVLTAPVVKAAPMATEVLTGPVAPKLSGLDAVDPTKASSAPVAETMMSDGPSAPAAAPKRESRAAPGTDYASFVGQEMCGYIIKRKLAEGGMGVVFEGEHQKIGRKGAIKVLKLEYCQSDEVVERFYQEARAVNSIRHENIVDIYDFGRDADGRVFFVMEFLEGESLSDRIKRGAIPWAEAFPILEQTLRALKAAHDKGFVHRDLKPDNIWLQKVDGGGAASVKLLDFGIAKLVGTDDAKEKLTRTGSIMGTPHYMSPEQINGSKDIDLRTDIYAMGVITYEMFAGKTPFLGDTLQAIMTGHLFTEPPRLDDVPKNLGVPGPLAEVIDRMLVKDAANRYASASDVLADLRDINKNRQPTLADSMAKDAPARKSSPSLGARVEREPAARDAGARELAAASPRRPVGLIAGVAVAAVLAAGGILYWKAQSQKPHDDPAHAPPIADHAPAPVVPPPPPPEKPLDYDAIRTDAETTLRAAIKEAEPATRVHGADALGKIKDQPSVPALTELTEKDPDPEARGHAADALGAIGATAATALLSKLEPAAPGPLKVWYASALARMGDKSAKKRLLGYAADKDLKISFKAALALADVSQPGDQDTIKALRVLAGHEQELNDIAPYAGAVILTKMAALHDAQARKLLYSILEAKDEGSRLAAAEGLARLGDDAGKKVLEDVYGNDASPNRLVATVALVPLGDYVGYDLITQRLADKDPDTRRLAARGLGEIGERKSVRALLALTGDTDWSVKIAAAQALIAIVGLAPEVLAQASVDWTKSALGSEDWAVRKAAASALGDLPEKQAVPLLAAAIADPDPKVRLAASTSARKMRGAEAATQVASAAKAEKDPQVKEEQVRALGAIGNAAAHDTLVELQADPGRVGVFAAGSLIAVGDPAGKAKLDLAVVAAAPDLRLAAVQSASAAGNPIVVPTLKIGVADKVFDVRFTAAEGLAGFHAEKAAAVPVLQAGLAGKDAAVQGRAESALLALGEKLPASAPSPASMIDSPDAAVRLAAIPAISALSPSEAAPLLRRVVTDTDAGVRRAGVDAIAKLIPVDKDAAVRLYKPLVTDADAVVRSKAQGQLSRLVEAPPKAALATPPPADPVTPPPPAADDPKIKTAADEAAAAAGEVKTAAATAESSEKELAGVTAQVAKDDTALKQVEQLNAAVDAAAKRAEAGATHAEAAAKAAADAAGATPSPDAARLVLDAKTAATAARAAATEAHGKAEAADKLAQGFAKTETVDPQMLVSAADAAIATGDLRSARHDLEKAQKGTGAKAAGIDFSYAQLFDKLAAREKEPTQKKKLLEQAKSSYEAFAKSGTGGRVQRATDRAAELADDIKELGAQ